MCGTFGQVDLDYPDNYYSSGWTKHKDYAKRIKEMNQKSPKSYRISSESEALIMRSSNEGPVLENAKFRWWGKKRDGKLWPVFNVRVEGGWKNKENSPDYKGPFEIYGNPYVKEIIMPQRCVVPVDFFVEQPEDKKRKQKFVIRKESREPFFLGGVYNDVVFEETGEVRSHFAILTTAYSKITIRAEHQRSPLIVPGDLIDTYLNPNTLEDTLNQFFHPADSDGFECFEVDYAIAKIKDHPYDPDDPRYIQPIGEVMRPVA